MTHLRIEQNNGITEQVSPSVIEKLYEIVHSGNLDSSSNLVGSLNTTSTYLNYVDYLEELFTKNGVRLLVITANKLYISFADPEVASYWANSSYGDGTGITSNDANSVLSIPNNAFKNNTSILTFNELNKFSNCITIGEYAFLDSSLESIDLSNITTLNLYAFSGSSLSGVLNMPNVNSIGLHSLRNNTNLEEVNIGTNVTESNKVTIIPNLTFYLDTNLLKVTGLSKVTSIGGQAFYQCSNLTSLDLTSELTTITAGETFRGCSELQCVNFLNVSNLSYTGTFMYCGKLVDLGTSDINNINTGAATYAFDWNSIPENTFTATLLTNKSFSFPNATVVNSAAFNTCTGIITISIPNVVSIEGIAFLKCSSLTTITGNNIITIGLAAFNECSALSSINLSNVTNIGQLAFNKCRALTTINLPKIVGIGGWGFSECSGLLSVTFGPNLLNISSMGFTNCTSLTTVIFDANSSVSFTGSGGFQNCTSLNTVNNISAIKQLYNNIFYNCTSLGTNEILDLNLPNQGDQSMDNAFYGTKYKGLILHIPLAIGGRWNYPCWELMNSLEYLDLSDTHFQVLALYMQNQSPLKTVILGSDFNDIRFGYVFDERSAFLYLIILSTNVVTLTGDSGKFYKTFTNSSYSPNLHIYVLDSALISAYLADSSWSLMTDLANHIHPLSDLPAGVWTTGLASQYLTPAQLATS